MQRVQTYPRAAVTPKTQPPRCQLRHPTSAPIHSHSFTRQINRRRARLVLPTGSEDCRLVGRDLIASVVIMERLMLSILHLALEGVSTVIFPPTQVCSNSFLPLDRCHKFWCTYGVPTGWPHSQHNTPNKW